MDQLSKIDELRRALDDLRERNLSLKEKFNALYEFLEAEKFPSQKVLADFNKEFSDFISDMSDCLKLYDKRTEKRKKGVSPWQVSQTKQERVFTLQKT